MNLTINLMPSRKPVVLGLAPGARRVGLAVMDSQELLTTRVLNVGQIRSREGKETRFRQVVTGLLDDYRVTHAALVHIERQDPALELLNTLMLWFEAEATARQIEVRELAASAVRDALVVDSTQRANNRNLAETLCHRFPELHDHAPSARAGPGGAYLSEFAATSSKFPSDRERYWQRMFLALGGALLTRDHLLLEEVSQ